MNTQTDIQESCETDKPLIEVADLLRRCMGKVDFATRMLGRFEETFAAQVEELRGVAIEDADEVARLAHRMKGAAANIGADRLAARLSTLNELAEGENDSVAGRTQEAVDRVMTCWNETRDFMKSISLEGVAR